MITSNNNPRNGKVNINGKEYITVAYRLAAFRKQYPIKDGWAIETECVQCDNQKVLFRAQIKNPCGKVLATGYAEEKRDGSFINRTSALENAETSAIGRALANAGFIGTEFASADEIAIAVQAKQNGNATTTIQGKVPGLKPLSKTAEEKAVQKGDLNLPDITKPGWEETPVPAQLLPYAERTRTITWRQLISNTVTLQGKNKVLPGAAYLHIVEKWQHPLAQLPEVQVVVKAALLMRERVKAGTNSAQASVTK